MNEIYFPELLFNLSISLIGGLVKTMIGNTKAEKTNKKLYSKPSAFITWMLAGGFAGILTYLLCSYFNLNSNITCFASGVAGYMGDNILEIFSDFLPKLLTGKLNIQIKDNGKEDKS